VRFGQVAVGTDGSVYGGSTGAQAKIWKMDSSQARAWEYQLSVAINLQTDCIQIDSSNNIYCYGRSGQTGYIFKIDSSGTLQWTRTLTTNGSLDVFRVRIINDIMYVFGNGYVSGSSTGGFIMKLPTDGTKTGTYGNFVYSTYSASLTSINEMTVNAFTPAIDSATLGNFNSSTTPSISYSSPGFSTLTKTTV
jgi:6-phosphogluconolactonase (cycloisomerase 2 family)